VKALIHHESPFINGDGSYSRDFTYIDNVIQANELAATVSKEEIVQRSSLYNMNLPANAPLDLVFNVAYGGNTTLIDLYNCLRENLAKFDPEIATIEPTFRANRAGDIPHSQASILKAQRVLGYDPKFDARAGFAAACEWYWNNIR
jgi:UDP-N-acetylglucosamine 4-epimerase